MKTYIHESLEVYNFYQSEYKYTTSTSQLFIAILHRLLLLILYTLTRFNCEFNFPLYMACLTALPFDIHVLIVKQLSLKDSLAYIQVSTITHDAVYHVFAHRLELNFQSVLDDNNTIALPPEILMKVLYAHTRAETITNFCFHPSFNLYADFTRYFHFYWARRWVDIDGYGFCQMTMGHPTGNLFTISYLGTHNGGATEEHSLYLETLWKYLQDWLIPIPQPIPYSYPPHTPNWSTMT